MAGQIFERKGWAKKHNLRLLLRLKKLKLDPSIRKVFHQFDKKDLLIKNLIYLVRLNDLEYRSYVDCFLLMELLFCNHFLQFGKIDPLKYEKKINVTIERLESSNPTSDYEYDYESEIFADINERLSYEERPFTNHHKLYNNIAQIFYRPFVDLEQGKLYYRYGYVFTMLLTMLTLQRVYTQNVNVGLFVVKLNIINIYNKTIAQITPAYFNDFIRQNNYYLRNYK